MCFAQGALVALQASFQGLAITDVLSDTKKPAGAAMAVKGNFTTIVHPTYPFLRVLNTIFRIESLTSLQYIDPK